MIKTFESYNLDGSFDDDFDGEKAYEIVGLPSGNILDVTEDLLFVLDDWELLSFIEKLDMWAYDDRHEALIITIGHCESFELFDYIINEDGSVNVDSEVDLSYKPIENGVLPIKFRYVNGDFNANGCGLTSLFNFPMVVNGNCSFNNNKITSLYGSPDKVSGNYDCSHNKIKTLEGGPDVVEGKYICSDNLITNLNYIPFSIEPMNLVYLPNENLEQDEIDHYWEQEVLHNQVNVEDIKHLVSMKLLQKYDMM